MSETIPQGGLPTPAEMYERFFVPGVFAPWARVLLELAVPRAGERALDLACGTGVVARQLAPILGPEGAVVALDLRAGMLAVARGLPALPAGAAAIEWRQGDALAPDLPDGAFDLIVCQQGLQFFADRLGALRQVHRLLAPGGRALLAVWQGFERHPVYEALARSEARHLAPLGVSYDEVAAPFLLGEAEVVRALLGEAGFREVEVATRSQEVHFPAAEGFVASVEYAYGAVVPAFVADPAAFASFVEAVTGETRAVLQRYQEDDQTRFPMHANIFIARPWKFLLGVD